MKNILYKSILLSVFSFLIGCQSRQERFDLALQKSIHWIWMQQATDGGWHSITHAVLKDGKALTPYILYHLLLISEDVYARRDEAVDKAVEFIRIEIKASMSMSKDSQTMLNYPNYSAAYALKVLCFLQQDTTLQRIIADHLLREQFKEHRGITPENLAYGGWGYGEPDLPHGEHGHVDISHTRRITESLMQWIKKDSHFVNSLTEAGITPTHPGPHLSRSHVLALSPSVGIFLKGVQRSHDDLRLYEGCISRKDLPYDGGFISSAVTLATNKSEPVFYPGAGYHYPSYATATCDGLLALHALGLSDTQPYKDAAHWLLEHQQLNTVDGLSPNDPEQWHQVMHYYHLAVRSEAMISAGISGPWSEEMSRILIREQMPEGYYVNPIGGVNKEDDPLMATILAIQAGSGLKRILK